jgi:anti-sigma factor RsiW
MSEYPELDRLLSRFLDGAASSEDMAMLESQLQAEERFADHFARWCLAHRQITELLTESELHRLMDQFVTSSPGLPKDAFRKCIASEKQAAGKTLFAGRSDAEYVNRHRKGRWFRASLAMAVGASAVGVVAGWLMFNRLIRNENHAVTVHSAPSDPSERAPSSSVATLTQVVNAVWAADAPLLHHGQPLGEGSRIAIASGMAKVTFDCGAEVTLQGPCDFVVRNHMVGVLRSGRMTANVPRRAFSFAILSPQVDFVDLGTSFGVAVGDNGRTELHVFEGEVLCSRSKPQDGQRDRAIHVTAKKAMEFGSSTGPPSDIAMNEQDFSKLIALRRAAQVESGHLVEDELALWLAADIAVTTDRARRVISWQDILYGDNQSAEDAVQAEENARPLLVKDALNGQPAIRFDGESDFLLTTPLETTDDQTVLFVCQFSPSAFNKDRRWGGQILNYDGPPSRYLSDTLQPGVLQIGEPLLEEEFQPSLLTGQVFAGFIGSAVVESGRVDARQVGVNMPVVVAFVYDHEYENGKSYLTINGRSYGEARAFAPQGITSRKIIGRHAWMQNYFHGDLAELLIFNKALTSEELQQTTAYLANKYSIKLDP